MFEMTKIMAKLNRKKKATDIMANLTAETKSKKMISSSASGKVCIFDKPKKRFTIKDLR